MTRPSAPQHAPLSQTEEHELPCLEAMLAGTLALMTGHSQALQAELHPQQRLAMAAKVADHLALLSRHPVLSMGFHAVLASLTERWQAMRDCTRLAGCECGEQGATLARRTGHATPVAQSAAPTTPYVFAPPETLQ